MQNRGIYPERPPTLAEALYSGKKFNKPENGDEILERLGLPPTSSVPQKKEEAPRRDLKKEPKKEPKKEKKTEIKQVVKQVDAHLDAPLPDTSESKIHAQFIKPEECEAVLNLQMDYILKRKSDMIKFIFRSRFFMSLFFLLLSAVSYNRIGEYFNPYTMKDPFSLLKNGYFLDDLFILFFQVLLFIAISFTWLRIVSAPLEKESKKVAENAEQYFGCDIKQYASVKNVNKPRKEDRDLVKQVKENTYCINYRDVPVAFLATTPGKEVKIVGFAVRRVYIKAELLKDLLGMMFKSGVRKAEVELFNFEEFDIGIFRKIGFTRTKREKFSKWWILTGVTRDTYSFDMDDIEF